MRDRSELESKSPSDVVGEGTPPPISSVRKERLTTAVVLLVIAAATVVDVIQDRVDGAPWEHILGELAIVIFAVVTAAVLIRRSYRPLTRKNRLLERQLTAAQADAKKWHDESSQLIAGLSTAISKQLDDWGLSAAEKEIALLLLKGLSHKEIAVIRETTEQTVRQQSASLYQKSGLTGRAELSAFFLEDLLILPALNQQADGASKLQK